MNILLNRLKDPFRLLQYYAKILNKRCRFEFARYYYQKSTVKDKRDLVRVWDDELEDFIFSEVIVRSTAEGYDFAIQSRIYFEDGQFIHIPMIDLSAKPTDSDIQATIRLFKDFSIPGLLFYKSGNSLHAYGFGGFIEDKDFTLFCARLLLLNTARHQLIDSRWIAHRLMARYFSLRISKTQKKYKRFPCLLSAHNVMELIP